MDDALYDSASRFFQELARPEPLTYGWVSQVIYAGLLSRTTPQTIWAAKKLNDLYFTEGEGH